MNLSSSDTLLMKEFFSEKPIIKTFLFGSYARNEAEKGSDVDIMVELDYSKQIGIKFFSYHMELEKLLHRKVDLVTVDSLSPHISPAVNKDKILIYQRTQCSPN